MLSLKCVFRVWERHENIWNPHSRPHLRTVRCTPSVRLSSVADFRFAISFALSGDPCPLSRDVACLLALLPIDVLPSTHGFILRHIAGAGLEVGFWMNPPEPFGWQPMRERCRFLSDRRVTIPCFLCAAASVPL